MGSVTDVDDAAMVARVSMRRFGRRPAQVAVTSALGLSLAVVLVGSVPLAETQAAFAGGVVVGSRTPVSEKPRTPTVSVAETLQVDRAVDVLACADALDASIVTPEIVQARADLAALLATYLGQQDESRRVSTVIAPVSSQVVSGIPGPFAFDADPTGIGVAVSGTGTGTSTSDASPVDPPSTGTPSDDDAPNPATPGPVATEGTTPGDGSADWTVDPRVLPEDGVPAPDGVAPDDTGDAPDDTGDGAAGSLPTGTVTLDDVIAAATYLASLVDPLAGVGPTQVTPVEQGPATAAERLAAAVAKYADSTRDYANGRIPASALCELSFAPGQSLRCDAAEQLDALAAEFQKAFGHPLRVSDSYRSFEDQVTLKALKPYLAAVPGTSQHGWGLAVDLGGSIPSGTSAEYIWLRTHGPDYGWDNPVWARPSGSKPEPWHFEFFAAGKMPTRYTPAEPIGPVSVPGSAPAATPGHSPTQAPTPTPAPSPTPSPSPTPAPSPTPSPSPTPAPSPAPTPAPTPTPTPSPPPAPSPTPTPVPEPTPTEPDPIPEPDPTVVPEPDESGEPAPEEEGRDHGRGGWRHDRDRDGGWGRDWDRDGWG